MSSYFLKVNTHQKVIHDRLEEFGWKFVFHEDLDAWWVDDTWRLRSIWSPQSCEAYLTFLVDPQADIHGRKPGESVWAVKVSPTYPTTQQSSDGEYVLDFGRGWMDRLDELFCRLTKIREQHRATEGSLNTDY